MSYQTRVLGYPGDSILLNTFYNHKPGRQIRTVRKIDQIWMEVYIVPDKTVEVFSMDQRAMIPYEDGTWEKDNWCEYSARQA